MTIGSKLLRSHVLTAAVVVAIDGITVGLVHDAETPVIVAAGVLATAVAAIVVVTISRRTARSVVVPLAAIATGSSTAGAPQEIRGLADFLDERATASTEQLDSLHSDVTRLEEILASLEEGVVLAGAGGEILYANPSARGLLGISDGGRLPPSLPESGSAEITLHHPERRTIRAATLPMPEGRRIIALQDVTELKRVEAMRRDFVGDASHELKTPVAAILATAETVESAAEDDPAAVPRFARTLVTEARRLSRLVQDLLDLARLEQPSPPSTPVALSEIVKREAETASISAQRKGLMLLDDIAADVRVAGSEADLTLAVRNLLDNAVRYTSEGAIRVRLLRDEGTAELSVTDTGRGIPAKDVPRIFERFYRVDEARARETGGTGLGLAIVKHVAERHGGGVHASSELGRGSRFILRLPCAEQRNAD